MEEISLANDAARDARAAERLRLLRAESASLAAEQSALTKAWEAEKGRMEAVGRLKEEIEKVEREVEVAEQQYELQKAAELKYSRLPSLQQELAEAEAAAAEEEADGGGARLVKSTVGEEDVAAVVAQWTGVPVAKMLASEAQKLLSLPDQLGRRVAGQEGAVEAVSEAIQRSRAGLSDPTKPIASFMFLGPTGVGKTELCKALAEALFEDEDAMVRIDMSEYMSENSVSRLVGAPPGYVGYEQGGQLTEAVRRRPYSVLLFDEMDKAHPDVFNVLLQVLDDGRLTDGQGRTVNFKNTVVILTSNQGSHHILAANRDPTKTEEARLLVLDALREKYRPEFLNRLDEFVLFEPLRKEELRSIVKLQVEALKQRLAPKRISLQLSQAALDVLVDLGYSPEYGARPLKRVVQKELETALARGILGGDYGEGDTVLVDPDSRTAKLVLRVAKAGEAVEVEKEGDEPTGGVEGEAFEVA